MKTKIKLFDIYVFLITLFKGFGAESNNKGYVLAFVIGCIAIVTKMARERYTTSVRQICCCRPCCTFHRFFWLKSDFQNKKGKLK